MGGIVNWLPITIEKLVTEHFLAVCFISSAVCFLNLTTHKIKLLSRKMIGVTLLLGIVGSMTSISNSVALLVVVGCVTICLNPHKVKFYPQSFIATLFPA